MGSKSTEYWNDVADEWAVEHRQLLWRAYSDRVNRGLIDAWLHGEPVARALKTDCFDEAVSELAIYPKLSTLAKSVVGVDLSTATLQRARQRHEGLQTSTADVCRLPFADQSFDFVFSNSTLDHMDSLDDVTTGLRELYRVTRSGGQLVLTLDNLWNPVVALRNALPQRLLARLGVVPYHVGATCGPRRLERMVREAGFEPRSLGACVHCPRLPAIRLGSALERRARPATRETFLRFMLSWERLARWPTRYLTGYFVVVAATRR